MNRRQINMFLVVLLSICSSIVFGILIYNFMGASFGIVFSVILAIIISYFVSLNFSKTVDNVEKLIDKINNNDLMSNEEELDIKSFDTSYEKLKNVIFEMKSNFKDQVNLSIEIGEISEKLVNVVTLIKESMDRISENTEMTSSNSEKQFEMLRNSKNEIEDIVNTLNELKFNMNDTVDYTTDTIESTKNSIESISKILSTMDEIRELVSEIAKNTRELYKRSDEVINLNEMVNNISEQTNLLALNASIEAARAGEHGRGFAIVATEVSKLSQETNTVSNKISEVINNLQTGLKEISVSVEKDIKIVNDGYITVENTIKEFEEIKDSLEESSKKLFVMNENIVKVSKEGLNVSNAIVEVTKFSEEITSQMQEASSQIMYQNNEVVGLLELSDKMNENADDLLQFVANKVMLGKMLSDVRNIEKYLRVRDVNNDILYELANKFNVDVIYITDRNGVVKYCNDSQAIGLDLYAIDPSYKPLREGKVDYISTPIKHRVEDGKLFKFLSILNENKEVYQVGLGLETLLKI